MAYGPTQVKIRRSMKKYEFVKWSNGLEWLKLEPKILDEQILFAKKNNLHYFICHLHPADEIIDFSMFEQLNVFGFNCNFNVSKSNATINNFNNLRILICPFSEPLTLISFFSLTKLERLEITWNYKIEGLSELVNLKDLRLWKYKPSLKKLNEFNKYIGIEKMMLVQATIDSVDGIQGLNQLTELEIARPKGFKSFFTEDLEDCLINLKELELSFCKELNYDSIPQINNLIKFTITDGGDKIESLAFILKKMPNLEILICYDTTLRDGNLKYLLKHKSLKKVTIQHKKHYNIKEEEINFLLQENKTKR